MSNRVSIEPIHGTQGGTDDPCPACGARYCMGDFIEAIDYAIGKKYLFGIVSCECGRILNKVDLRKILPDIIYMRVFAE